MRRSIRLFYAQQVPHLFPLGVEITPVLIAGRRHDGHSFHYFQPESLQPDDLLGIVRERSEPPYA